MTASQFSTPALSKIVFVKLFPLAASFSFTLQAYNTGFDVNKLKFLILFILSRVKSANLIGLPSDKKLTIPSLEADHFLHQHH